MESFSARFSLLSLLIAVLLCLDAVQARNSQLGRRDATAAPDAKHGKGKKPSSEKTYTEEELYFNFVTRPDIRPIRWDIRTRDREALAPGYWFISPYAKLEQDDYSAWNGPHIYDQEGGLIWSGVPMFKRLNIYDFRLAEVNGEMMPTLIFTEKANGLILDRAYNIQHTVDMFGMELPQWLLDQIGSRHTTNMHDFNVIDNGERAIMLTKVYENATRAQSKAIGFDGECTAKYQGFKEVDVATSEILFDWSSHGNIELEESTYFPDSLEEMCNGNAGPGGWDIEHLNSIDKFPDGDYLLSSRHTNTLYKVSHKDKSIVWRLTHEAGNFDSKTADFHFLDEDSKFQRQHHSRIVSQNDTHVLLTVFNNARGTGKGEPPLGPMSTGLLLSLRTDVRPMTVSTVSRFDRPDGKYTAARGSVQMLESGNGFVGWSKHSLQSEHAPDGTLLQEAQLRHEGANTYRAYKYEWVGRPQQAPDIHSAAVDGAQGSVSTVVHMSWNGDTETKVWNLYKTNPRGESREMVGSTFRQGFESVISYKGYASYVLVEACDDAGNVLGTSRMIETLPPTNMISPVVATEAQWLQDHSNVEVSSGDWVSVLERPWVTYVLGVISCGFTVMIVYLVLRARQNASGRSWLTGLGSYQRVGEKELDENDFGEDTMVDEMSERLQLKKEDV